MCKLCKDKGFTADQIADEHDGEYEEREAALHRLEAEDLDDEYVFECECSGCGNTVEVCQCVECDVDVDFGDMEE